MKNSFLNLVMLFRVPSHIFGILNAMANFYKYINKIINKKRNIFIIVYLDNIFSQIEDYGLFYVKAM